MKSDASPTPPEDTETKGAAWAQVRELFELAIERDGSEREDFLRQHCAVDSKLRAEVDSLIADYEEPTDFLEMPVASIQSFLDNQLLPEGDPAIGARIGAYRLEKEIGQGGMGVVYLAARADSEFDKRVAIKLIRDGSESEMAVRRFRHERQILAQLEHAYIARLIDGGSTGEGTPYFVMEYVQGLNVVEFCDRNSLTNRHRLQLFLKICSAVEYAHERNIIHRDLKPGNMLVKQDGNPMLLDFGISKILSGDATDPDATAQGLRALTPAYASPEQLRGDPATAQADIYALGVILYELLCHQRPDPNRLYGSGAESAPHEQLSSALRAIVLRSIRFDPAERYSSVKEFSADIRRYLEGAPPIAHSAEWLSSSGTHKKLSVAVLPFRVLGEQSGSKAMLVSGVTESLITKLTRVERLSIPPSSAILKYADGVNAGQAARELRVHYVLEGSLRFIRGSVRANVQLVFAEAGTAVWATQIEVPETNSAHLEDSIAEQVANAVVPKLGEEDAGSRSATTSGEAYAA